MSKNSKGSRRRDGRVQGHRGRASEGVGRERVSHRELFVQQTRRRARGRRDFRARGRAIAVQGDVSKPTDLERLFSAARSRSTASTSW